MAILGIDEVGRGPWAGPLLIGAVILNNTDAPWCNDLADSKQLTAKKRENLNQLIIENAAAVGLGWVSSKELDHIGLSRALKLATRRAVKQIQIKKVPFSEIIIDGTINFLTDTPFEKHVTTLKKADALIKEVSAASIVAKVARDNYMKELAEDYPNYGFEKHVGYGTTMHREALKKYGPCPEHRLSFKPLSQSSSNIKTPSNECQTTKDLGDAAETKVADYLMSVGHDIIARNYKTKFYEIDIISTKDQTIYFTEVKYRKNDFAGGGLAAIDQKKQKQMKFAAESFLHVFPTLSKNYSPLLAAADVTGKDFKLKNWLVLD